MIEHDHLVFHFQADVIGSEELRILLFKFLPNEGGEARFNLCLVLQGLHYLFLRHVQLQTPFDQVLHQLDVLCGDFLATGAATWPIIFTLLSGLGNDRGVVPVAIAVDRTLHCLSHAGNTLH